MSDDLDRALAELRGDFDGLFARPPAEPAPGGTVALLALRAGAAEVAVRVLDAGGLLAARRVVPVPGGRPELLGVAGLRGDLVPVFGAARLLGAAEGAGAPRWLLLSRGEPRLALAFDAFDGHLAAPAAALQAAPSAAGAHVAEVARVGERALPVLSLTSIVRALTRR